MEKKLDWTMLRKKVEIQDSMGKPAQTTRTLRIFLSHTVSDQAWQTNGGPSGEAPNFEGGQGIPAWAFKIEGRVLEPATRSRDKQPVKKFSNLVKSVVVDIERDPNLHPEGNIVEWLRPQAAPGAAPPALDGFTVRRTGDSQTKLRVVIHLEHYPEQFKVQQDLGSVIDCREESRLGVITALWNYIKINNLQDKVDRRLIRLDDKLKHIFRADQLPFTQIPELVNHFLQPADPIVLFYTIKPNEPPPATLQVWDVEVKVEDTFLKNRMNQVILSMNNETAQELLKYEQEAAILAQQIQNSQLKRTFLTSFADDPAGFINKWLESQSRDLDSVLSSGPNEELTVREEELKRSEFFRLPWVEEAVAVQEGLRLASKSLM